MIREELKRLGTWEERHARLGHPHLLRCLLHDRSATDDLVAVKNPLSVAGRLVDLLLEIWAVLIVAGSAGAIASFFQTGDSN